MASLRLKIHNNLISKYVWPLSDRFILPWLDDETFTKIIYRRVFNKEINLVHPKTYNEKLNYLKLCDRNPEYQQMVDKYAVRYYLTKRGFGYLLNDLYGVYDRVQDIKFDALPDTFIIKPTHASGLNLICRDKNQLDWAYECKRMQDWLEIDYYKKTREWVYKGIKPRLIVERLLCSKLGTTPNDYKFYCFNGLPVYIQVDIDRYTGHRQNFFDLEWNLLQIEGDVQNTDVSLGKPATLEKMIQICKTLGHGFAHIRIDLYDVDGHIYFGELTLIPGGGLSKFTDRADDEWGALLCLD